MKPHSKTRANAWENWALDLPSSSCSSWTGPHPLGCQQYHKALNSVGLSNGPPAKHGKHSEQNSSYTCGFLNMRAVIIMLRGKAKGTREICIQAFTLVSCCYRTPSAGASRPDRSMGCCNQMLICSSYNNHTSARIVWTCATWAGDMQRSLIVVICFHLLIAVAPVWTAGQGLLEYWANTKLNMPLRNTNGALNCHMRFFNN